MEFIDFHTHILPGVDDGSASVEESLKMLRMEAEQGVDRVVLTPHFYPWQHTPEPFLERREAAFALLCEAMEKEQGLPGVILGGEVHFYKGMCHTAELEKLTIGGTKYLLVEMPACKWTDEMYRELGDIERNLGLKPIIAHLDRYISPLRTHGIPERLEELPFPIQVNAGFFLNRWNGGLARKLFRRGLVHLIGSDCHNTSSRPPCMSAALEKIRQMDKTALDEVCEMQRIIFDQ